MAEIKRVRRIWLHNHRHKAPAKLVQNEKKKNKWIVSVLSSTWHFLTRRAKPSSCPINGPKEVNKFERKILAITSVNTSLVDHDEVFKSNYPQNYDGPRLGQSPETLEQHWVIVVIWDLFWLFGRVLKIPSKSLDDLPVVQSAAPRK